jgi:hypothetical protein
MVWIQSGDLLMVWIQISLTFYICHEAVAWPNYILMADLPAKDLAQNWYTFVLAWSKFRVHNQNSASN